MVHLPLSDTHAVQFLRTPATFGLPDNDVVRRRVLRASLM